MNARRLKLSAVCVAMLLCNTLFTAWLLSGNAAGVAGASPLNQNAAAAAATTIPTAFSYQGTLRDANGNLVNGTVNLASGCMAWRPAATLCIRKTSPTSTCAPAFSQCGNTLPAL